MKTLLPRFAAASIAAVLLAPASAQRPVCEVLLRDGRALHADRVHGGAQGSWQLVTARGTETVDGAMVLAVLGTKVADSSMPAAHLAAGDVVRGLLVSGDTGGDTMVLQSPVFGRLQIPIDRLECLLLRPLEARATDLVLPEGAAEALFLPASLGFDRVTGTLHQFGEQGVRFQSDAEAEPRWLSPRDLVGLRLSGATAPSEPPIAELCTRAGDRIGLAAFTFDGALLRCTLEGGVLADVNLADLGCLLRLDVGAVHLSRLEPSRVVEAAFAGDVLMPWRRDLAVSSSMLAAAGRCYARGLGVHSRSRLQFVVPEGMGAFLTRVAFDDAALQLPVRGHVEIALRIEGAGKPLNHELTAGGSVLTLGPIDVVPGQVLSLEVEFGKGRDLGDRVDWLLPMFLPKATAK